MIENIPENTHSDNWFQKWFHTFRLFLVENEWILIGAAWAFAYVLGIVGIEKQFNATDEIRSFWDPFYRAFQLFFFDDSMVVAGKIYSWELETARFLAPAVATYTAFTALISFFQDRFQLYRLRRIRRHVVVCGIGRKGLGLVTDFRNQGIPVVAIEMDDNNDHIEICRELKAIVIVGDATESDTLRRARILLADKVIATTGNDGTNVEIAIRTYQMIKEKGKKTNHTLKCYIQVADSKLRVLFGKHPIFTDVTDSVDITIFNTYTNASRLLFERFPLDRKGIYKADNTEVHLIIVGFGQMGQNILLQAVRTSHFANGRKISVTIIDRMAEKKYKIFKSHYPQIETICTIGFITIEAEDTDLLDDISDWCKKENTFTTIVIALDNDARALSCALGFLLRLENPEIPIIVRMSEESGLEVLLHNEGASSDWMAAIHSFGITGESCNSKMLTDEDLDIFARKIHEDFISKQLKQGLPINDSSIYPWNKLNPDAKSSYRQQADHIAIKLRAINCVITSDAKINSGFDGFTNDEVELLACMEHNRRKAEQLLSNWAFLQKEPENGYSHYSIDWSVLPDPIREHSRETIRIIPKILALAGMRIERGIDEIAMIGINH